MSARSTDYWMWFLESVAASASDARLTELVAMAMRDGLSAEQVANVLRNGGLYFDRISDAIGGATESANRAALQEAALRKSALLIVDGDDE